MFKDDSRQLHFVYRRPRDRFITRVAAVLAIIAVTLAAMVVFLPRWAEQRPSKQAPIVDAAAVVEFGATSVDVYDQCGDWLGLPAGERLRGARHLLISLRHAAGVEAPGDYTPPVDSVTRRLLDDMRVDCLDGLDGDTIVAQLAMRAYRTDGALRS